MESRESGSGGWEALFDELIELPPAARRQRLDELRLRDAALAARLEQLLAADADSTALFDRTDLVLAELDEPEPGLADGTLVGPWRVLRLAGRGGMGEVYLAERADAGFAQQVALKVIKPGMDSQAIVRRFERERQILARLDHPHLAHLLDGGKAPDGRPYFALEWVDGQPITEYCQTHHLDVGARLRLVVSVCQAAAAAHRLLVVHRDIKPANILVTADGTVKLLDFGVAKLLVGDATDAGAQTLTQANDRVLTPAYASPEQILGEPVSTATDVYALGLLLYELLTGSLPHRRGRSGIQGLASTVERETVQRPSALLRRTGGDARLARQVSADLDLIVLTALHRDPEQRYGGPAALAEDLGRLLAGRPIMARPAEIGYRLRKFVGRNRVAVAAVAIGVAALVAGLAVSIHQTAAARAAARRAERVKSFLVSVFQQSDPVTARGANVTARELLARGAATLEHGLANEPEVQADLFDALARIETSLGLLDPALAHAQRALTLRQAQLGPADGRIGQSWAVLGVVQGTRGALADARRSLATAVARLVPAYGAGSLEVAGARRDLASVLQGPRDGTQAVALLRQALAVSVRVRGEGDVESIDTLTDLGVALVAKGDYAPGEAALRRAVALYNRTLGPRNVKAATAQSELASLLQRDGRMQEARPLLEDAIATERAALGPRHVALADTLTHYGVLLMSFGEYDTVDRVLREAAAIYGPDHYGQAQCLRYLGVSAMEREHWAAAADFFARSCAAYRHTLGDADSQGWRALANLGYSHFHLGQRRLGRSEMDEALAHIEKLSGPETYELLLPWKQKGEMLTADGDSAQAVALLRRERGLEIKLFHKVERRAVAQCDLLLARALLAHGDSREARQALDESLAIFARVDPRNSQRGEALLLRGRLAIDDGDRVLARSALTAAESLLAARKGPDHPDTRAAHRLLTTV